MEKRPYRMKARAERQAETRRRIVEAAVELHTTLGPAGTSISAIADRAGVQRHTVYAHFPDDEALFAACSSHWRELHPFPDPEGWESIADPRRRLRRALRELYAWYEAVEPDWALIRRDEHLYPSFGLAWESRMALDRGVPRRAVRPAEGRRGRGRPRARVRDVALARPPPGPLERGGRRR